MERVTLAAGAVRRIANGTLVADTCPFHDFSIGPILHLYPAPPNLMFHCFACGMHGKATLNADGSYTLDPENPEQETLDRHYPAAVEIVSAAGYGANRLLQDRLNLSYWRASVLIAALRAAGILGDELDEDARFKLIAPRGFY